MDKKLKPDDLQELIRRQKLIADHMLTAQSLQLHTELFVKDILKREGINGDKYEINLQDGSIIEVKKDVSENSKK